MPITETRLGEIMARFAELENRKARQNWGRGYLTDPKVLKANGSKGGRLKTGQNCKMSARAKTVNRLIHREMAVTEISDVLGVSHQAVSQIIKRYGLPRAIS